MRKIVSLIVALTLLTTTFGMVVVSAAAFTDINETHWAFESVEKLTADGTINGYSDGSFKPDGTVTRAEFVKMLGKSSEMRDSDFADVDKNHWAYDYVMYSGLEGDDENKFNPDVAILRSDVANLLYKRFSNGTDAIAPYAIASQGTDSKATAWVYTYGLMVGDDMVNLRLNDTITRSEAAVLIVRAKTLDLTKQRSFIDNFSDETYKAVYEGSNLFDSEYDANANISNGEVAAAAMRLKFKNRTEAFGAYRYETKYEGKYAKEWAIACANILDDEKFSPSEKESKANATVGDSIAMLAHAAKNDSYFKNINPDKREVIYEEFKDIGEGNLRSSLQYAYDYGISLYADGVINAERPITKKEIACIVLQLDLINSSNIGYRCGYECTYVSLPVRKDVSTYPSNSADFMTIAEDIPNAVYETPFNKNVIENSKKMNDMANNLAMVYVTPFTTVCTAAYNVGVNMYITYVPSLMAKVDGGYMYRVKFEFEKAPEGAVLSDIFLLADGVEDLALTEGLTFWADLATNAELSGLYIDWELMSVEQIIK